MMQKTQPHLSESEQQSCDDAYNSARVSHRILSLGMSSVTLQQMILSVNFGPECPTSAMVVFVMNWYRYTVQRKRTAYVKNDNIV
jgi:hypothetical protein